MNGLAGLFSGGAYGLLDAALVIGFFWVALAQPNRINRPVLFRVATILLAISIVAPVMIAMLPPFLGGRPAATTEYLVYFLSIPPLLKMLAFLLVLGSITPRSGENAT